MSDPDEITPLQRMLSGGLAGAVAQVRPLQGAILLAKCGELRFREWGTLPSFKRSSSVQRARARGELVVLLKACTAGASSRRSLLQGPPHTQPVLSTHHAAHAMLRAVDHLPAGARAHAAGGLPARQLHRHL